MSAYLNTRVSLFASRLLSPAQFAELVNCPDADVSTCLAAHGLDYLTTQRMDGVSINQRISAALLREITILIRPLRGAPRSFLEYWTRRYEISNLKTLIRGKLAHKRPAEISTSLLDAGEFTRLPIEDLLHAEDLTELLNRLEHSAYADLARSARQTVEKHKDPFMLDAMLDKCYFEGLLSLSKTVEKQEGENFRRLVGDMIDRTNLMWLVRYRFTYNLPPAQAYYLLIASSYRLPADVLKNLARQTELSRFIEALPAYWQKQLDNTADPIEVHAALEEGSIALSRRVLGHSTSAVTRAFSYVLLRERCLHRVLAVLRGRSLSLDTASINHAVALEDPAALAEVV